MSKNQHNHQHSGVFQFLTTFLFGFQALRGFTCELKMTDPRTLLAEYVNAGSETAFRELVARYVNLVYSTALRLVGANRQLAEDATQTVFINLARRAKGLSGEIMLGGWLHQHTFHVASKIMRKELRRQAREREAVQMRTIEEPSGGPDLERLRPLLDEAITRLSVQDRAAVLLRYFEQLELRIVGEQLGISEDAARMRVNRALEKLRGFFHCKGVSLSVSALGVALSSEAISAAPAGMAASVAGAALTTTAGGCGFTFGLLKLMAISKCKLGVTSALVVAGLGTFVVQQHNTNAKLRAEVAQLHQQAPPAILTPSTAKLSESHASGEATSEILRLRGRVGVLTRELGELAVKSNSSRGLRMVQNEVDFLNSNSIGPEEAQLILTRDSLRDVGVATPEAALETYLWNQQQSMGTNALDVVNGRLKEIVYIPPGVEFAGVAEGAKLDPLHGSDFGKIEAISYPSSDQAKVQVNFYDRNQGYRSGTTVRLFLQGESWKIDIGLRPN